MSLLAVKRKRRGSATKISLVTCAQVYIQLIILIIIIIIILLALIYGLDGQEEAGCCVQAAPPAGRRGSAQLGWTERQILGGCVFSALCWPTERLANTHFLPLKRAS